MDLQRYALLSSAGGQGSAEAALAYVKRVMRLVKYPIACGFLVCDACKMAAGVAITMREAVLPDFARDLERPGFGSKEQQKKAKGKGKSK